MNDDESTAPSQQIINTDHIVVTTPPVAYENTDASSLPPLDSTLLSRSPEGRETVVCSKLLIMSGRIVPNNKER